MNLLRQPLGPFSLAILVGVTAGYIGMVRDSVMAFGTTTMAGAVAVGLLDLLANATADWHEVAEDSDGIPTSMLGLVRDQVSANVVIIGVVGGLASLLLWVV